MERKRIINLFTVCMACLMLIIIRLFYIQVIGMETAEETYVQSRRNVIEGINYRGMIIDRNGIPMVNRSSAYLIFAEKTKTDEEFNKLMSDAGSKLISRSNMRYYIYKSRDLNKDVLQKITEDYGFFIATVTERYEENQPAAHILGYCSTWDNNGIFGIEKALNEKLYTDRKLFYTSDSTGRILKGRGLSLSESVRTSDEENNEEPADSVQLTIDYELQKKTEEIISASGVEGAAAVIIDVKSGEIVTCASYPSFDPSNTEKAKGTSLINKAIQTAYPPGSVFKIVVAAAALEAGIVTKNDMFFCSGAENFNGVCIKCGKEEGHGNISFKDAFAKSCNCVFIQLGNRLGGEKLIEMAEKLGLNSGVLNILDEESEGRLPDYSMINGAGTANLSIGQGECEITCLQAAKLSAIIAGMGTEPHISLLKEEPKIPENSGSNSKNISDERKKVISTKTAIILKALMKAVVSKGTGVNAGENVAGKTGSAQGVYKGNQVVHGWFTGFFPADSPEYSVAVFTEASGGSSAAIKIFSQIAKYLY